MRCIWPQPNRSHESTKFFLCPYGLGITAEYPSSSFAVPENTTAGDATAIFEEQFVFTALNHVAFEGWGIVHKKAPLHRGGSIAGLVPLCAVGDAGSVDHIVDRESTT